MKPTAAPLARRRFFGRIIAALAGGAWLSRAGRAEAAAVHGFLPYVGEIRMFAGSFAPVDWAFCHGQFLLIADFESLFNLIGTTYGGDGETTFALPDLRGRAPMHHGQGSGLSSRALGELGGEEWVTLNSNQLPAHSHAAGASAAIGDSADPTGRVPARNAAGVPQYATATNTTLAPAMLSPTGGTFPHPNVQPFLGVNYIIALNGIFPSSS
jgi:microcystin-dependent protein